MVAIATQQHWFENLGAEKFHAVCKLSGNEIEVDRSVVDQIDKVDRGLAGDARISELIELGLVRDLEIGDHSIPRIGIVITVRDPPPEFVRLLSYHAKNFCSKIYVFDDNSKQELPIPSELSEVVHVIDDLVVDETNELYQRHKPFFGREVMSRQIWNTQRAIELAADDKLDWLFHLDEDELLHLPRGAATMATIPPEIGNVVVLNDEVVVTNLEYDCYVTEASLFKKNPKLIARNLVAKKRSELGRQHYYTAYTNGKSAVRIGAGARPNGVHRFIGPADFPSMSLLLGARVLHYANCGFRNFLRKYQLRIAMSDKYFDRKKRIDFHLQARDSLRDNGERGLEKFYLNNVLFTNEQIESLNLCGMSEYWGSFD